MTHPGGTGDRPHVAEPILVTDHDGGRIHSWEGRYGSGMNARRVLLLIGGLVLILVGLLWTLQGLGKVGGSAMSGVTLWAIVGPVVAVVGAYLIWRGSRRTPARPTSSGPPTSQS